MTIVIIDDAKIVREGLKKIIQTNCPQYEILGEAADGEQGLLLLEETKPDVCIVDMKMPKMNGIKMVSRVRQTNTHTKFIVLSAYSDFSYARAMISHGCSAYLLKPVDHQELITLLNSLKTSVEEEVGEKIDDTPTFTRLAEDGELSSKSQELLQDSYSVVHLLFDRRREEETSTQIIDHIKSVLGDLPTVAYLQDQDSIVLLIGSAMKKTVEDALTVLAVSITKKYGITFSAGMQNAEGSASIMNIYQEATTALESCFYQPEGTMVWYDGEKEAVDHAPFFMLEGQVFMNISMEDHHEAAKRIITFGEKLRSQQADKRQALLVLDRLYTMILKTFKRQDNVELLQRLPDIDTFIDQLASLKKITDFEEQLAQISKTLEAFNDETNEKDISKRATLRKVLRFISKNLEKDISLADAAKVCHMTPSYFSLYFKKEMGETYISFLNRMKIERAKELLQGSSIRIYELASMLGFKDSRYFSRKFKEFTGKTPREYRESI